jgi:hypothetical protein
VQNQELDVEEVGKVMRAHAAWNHSQLKIKILPYTRPSYRMPILLPCSILRRRRAQFTPWNLSVFYLTGAYLLAEAINPAENPPSVWRINPACPNCPACPMKSWLFLFHRG